MSDATAERNDRTKAAMRQKATFLTSNEGKGQTPCATRQAPETRRHLNHIEVATGKRS
jgi:hypothetical protein